MRVLVTPTVAVFLLLLGGCASQRDGFELTDPSAAKSESVVVVVTQRGENPCWTNRAAIANSVSGALSTAYDDVTVATADAVQQDDRLVFQIFGWVFRRSGLCFGNFRISVGTGLERTEDGFVDVQTPVAATKRNAILASPETMNARALTFAETAARQFAEQINTMR